MFSASQAFAHRVPAGLAAPGHTYWRALEITLSAQWYIVQMCEGVDGEVMQRDLLVSWTSDLLSIIRGRGAVTSIQLMEPVPTRGTAPWKSRTLTRIWIAIDPTDGRKEIAVFETVDGCRSCDAMERGSSNGLVDYRLAWEMVSASAT